MPPEYAWDEFFEACQRGEARVWYPAIKLASQDFQLHTEDSILEFISNGGLQRLSFINRADFKAWTGKPPPPIVDAYNFYTGPKKGYLAFYQMPNWTWIIKSFHKDRYGLISIP